MKTSRAGSRSGWLSNQASRFAAPSGRVCSLACAVFFDGHVVTVEAAPDRARCEADPVFRSEFLRQFDEGNVGPGVNRSQQNARPHFDPMRTTIAALPQRVLPTARTPFRYPPDHAGGGNTKALGAARRVIPEETAAMARRRRSDDSARVMIAGPHPGNQDESDFGQYGNPKTTQLD